VTPARIKRNFEVFDFELTTDQLKQVSGLDAGNRMGPNPDELNRVIAPSSSTAPVM
jgi:2,5-diketo-D-gluconate reductase A